MGLFGSNDFLPHRASLSGGGITGSSDSSITIAGADAIINQALTPTWTGAHIWNQADNGTTSVPTPITLQHRNNAAGTPAAGYGIGALFKLDSAARTLRSAVEVDAVWSTATDAAEVSSLAIKTMLAGALTETVRFGTGASLPDSDLSVSLGRVLIDSRATDQAWFSHRDMTTTAQGAVQQQSSGATTLNAASGQTLRLAIAGTPIFTLAATDLSPSSDNAKDIGQTALRVRRQFLSEYFEMSEVAAPSAPGADKGRLFVRDNGSSKSQLCIIFPTGAVQVIATEP